MIYDAAARAAAVAALIVGMFCAGAAGECSGPIVTSGGAGWAGPTYVGAGAGLAVGVGGGTNGVPYPTGLAAGDFFILHCTGHTGTVSTPAGWTAYTGPQSNGVSETGYLFTKSATGSETGSLNVTSTTYMVARMYAFRGVTSVTTFSAGTNASPNNAAPAVTTAVANCLDVCFQGGYGSTPDSITGSTGGTWTQQTNYRDASTLACSMHTYQAAAAGTITGGSSTTYGECVGLALGLVP